MAKLEEIGEHLSFRGFVLKDFGRYAKLFVSAHSPGGATYRVKLVLEPVDEGRMFEWEDVTADGENAQKFLIAMANACIEAGLTPDKKAEVDARLQATERHLDDMRKIAMHKIGVK